MKDSVASSIPPTGETQGPPAGVRLARLSRRGGFAAPEGRSDGGREDACKCSARDCSRRSFQAAPSSDFSERSLNSIRSSFQEFIAACSRLVSRWIRRVGTTLILLPNPVRGRRLRYLAASEQLMIPTADGPRLHSIYFPAGRDALTILFFHGVGANLGHCVAQLRVLHEAGFGVMGVDYRGFGKSEGFPEDEESLHRDGIAAFDSLIARGVKAESIILLGRSLASVVAAAVARERSCAGVILESPLSSAPDLWRSLGFPSFLIGFLSRTQVMLDAASLVKSVKAPALIIHGSRDRLAPEWMARKILACLPGDSALHVLSGVGHYGLHRKVKKPYLKLLRDFARQIRASDH